MMTRMAWGLMLAGLLCAAGCKSTSDVLTPLNNDQLKSFFSRAQDPRRFWITVYEAEEGANFAGACRLHPEQVARRFASINNAAPAFSEATRLFAGEGDKQP